jgi:hypothetical protein
MQVCKDRLEIREVLQERLGRNRFRTQALTIQFTRKGQNKEKDFRCSGGFFA